jgi:hypothetical protein
VAASNPPLITFESRESQLQIRGNLKLEFAGKSPPKPKFPANPVAEIPAISIADQSLRDISRSTFYGGVKIVKLIDTRHRDETDAGVATEDVSDEPATEQDADTCDNRNSDS